MPVRHVVTFRFSPDATPAQVDALAYRDHPEHQALIRDLVTPIVTDRIGCQFAT